MEELNREKYSALRIASMALQRDREDLEKLKKEARFQDDIDYYGKEIVKTEKALNTVRKWLHESGGARLRTAEDPQDPKEVP